MSSEEIEIEVMRRYPKNEDERRGCQSTIKIRNEMRDEYRERLKQFGENSIKPGIVA